VNALISDRSQKRALKEFNQEDKVIPFPRNKFKKQPPPEIFEVFVIYYTDDLEKYEDERNRNWKAIACRSNEELAQEFIREQPYAYGIRWGYEKFPYI
jgi:hypothetical protein